MKSMTGFASGKGSGAGASWTWDIRAVNARGLDARLRLPDWIPGLEPAIRAEIKKSVARGNINLTLKLTRDETGEGVGIDVAKLGDLLSQIKMIEDTALQDHDLNLAQTSAADLLAMPGLSDASAVELDADAVKSAVQNDLSSILTAFDAMRETEGKALQRVLAQQLDQIEELVQSAEKLAKERASVTAQTLKENLARVMQNTDGVDPDRLAQELAILAVKADVKEEIDRLDAHVSAARGMLKSREPVGRKLDFLAQEFNREANTLCSKAQSNELTRTGLNLKAVIEQMREQVQNVE